MYFIIPYTMIFRRRAYIEFKIKRKNPRVTFCSSSNYRYCLMISIFLIPMELGTIVMFLTGAIMLIVGMGFFQLGAEMSMTPIGEG